MPVLVYMTHDSFFLSFKATLSVSMWYTFGSTWFWYHFDALVEVGGHKLPGWQHFLGVVVAVVQQTYSPGGAWFLDQWWHAAQKSRLRNPDILKERIHHTPKFHSPFELSIFYWGGDFLSTRIILDLKEIYGNIICFSLLFDCLMLRIRSYVHLTLECFHSLPKGLEAVDPEQWRVKFVWTDLYKEMLRNNYT